MINLITEHVKLTLLTLKDPFISESCTEIKIVKFLFSHLHKTFWGTTKKCENKNLIMQICKFLLFDYG